MTTLKKILSFGCIVGTCAIFTACSSSETPLLPQAKRILGGLNAAWVSSATPASANGLEKGYDFPVLLTLDPDDGTPYYIQSVAYNGVTEESGLYYYHMKRDGSIETLPFPDYHGDTIVRSFTVKPNDAGFFTLESSSEGSSSDFVRLVSRDAQGSLVWEYDFTKFIDRDQPFVSFLAVSPSGDLYVTWDQSGFTTTQSLINVVIIPGGNQPSPSQNLATKKYDMSYSGFYRLDFSSNNVPFFSSVVPSDNATFAVNTLNLATEAASSIRINQALLLGGLVNDASNTELKLSGSSIDSDGRIWVAGGFALDASKPCGFANFQETPSNECDLIVGVYDQTGRLLNRYTKSFGSVDGYPSMDLGMLVATTNTSSDTNFFVAGGTTGSLSTTANSTEDGIHPNSFVMELVPDNKR